MMEIISGSDLLDMKQWKNEERNVYYIENVIGTEKGAWDEVMLSSSSRSGIAALVEECVRVRPLRYFHC